VFNLPGAQAAIVTDSGSVISPERKTHIAPSAGATFWITPALGVYGDFVAIDGGKAFAQLGSDTVTVTDNLYAGYGGVQFQAHKTGIRPYVDFGVGGVHDSAQMTLDGVSQPASANAFSVRGGGGLRTMVSSHWGVKVSAEVYYFRGNGVSRTYPRIGVGWFYQTKPSGEVK